MHILAYIYILYSTEGAGVERGVISEMDDDQEGSATPVYFEGFVSLSNTNQITDTKLDRMADNSMITTNSSVDENQGVVDDNMVIESSQSSSDSLQPTLTNNNSDDKLLLPGVRKRGSKSNLLENALASNLPPSSQSSQASINPTSTSTTGNTTGNTTGVGNTTQQGILPTTGSRRQKAGGGITGGVTGGTGGVSGGVSGNGGSSRR